MKRRILIACSLLGLGCTKPSPYASLMEDSKDAALIDASIPEDLGADSTQDSGGVEVPDALPPDAWTPDATPPDIMIPDALVQDALVQDALLPDAQDALLLDALAAPADIRLELTWHTPNDDDESDNQGTDLDLHLRHSNGDRWSSQPWDCYSTNPHPDWGVLEDVTDDPEVLIDDQDGAGPEVLVLNHAEEGTTYRVGVKYYRALRKDSAGSYGPSDATVRIYLRGELAWTNDTSKTLLHDGDFWEVAQIVWVGDVPTVSVLDRML